MFIQTETTPNPNSLKFLPGRVVSNGGSFEITKKDNIKNDLIKNYELTEDQFYLSGISVIYNNLLQSLFQSLIGSLSIVFAAIFAMFIILFRSLYMAIIAMIPNLLSASSVLGIIGWSGIPIDIMTVTVAAISIGIGVDNTIHYVHRFLKEYEKNNNYDLAIKNTDQDIDNSSNYFFRGYSKKNLNKISDACQDFDIALKLSPENKNIEKIYQKNCNKE